MATTDSTGSRQQPLTTPAVAGVLLEAINVREIERKTRRTEGKKSMISLALRKYHKKEFGPATVT